MKRILYALFFVLLFTTFAQAQATKGLTVVPKSQRHALLIGINAYPEPVAPLKFCVKDMQDIAAELEKVGFPAENVHLMVDSSKGDMKPTGANIRAQIAKITGEMKEGDFLFVAFSGHGVLIDGKSYLCPIDIDTAKLETFVDREAMFRLLDDCKASRKIFLCDACRNEFTIKGTKGKSLLKTRALDDPMTTSLHGFILMSSCAEKQQSMEYKSFGNGVFTHFLLEGLRGAAANEKGYVSVMRLFAHANDRTINFTRGSQTPMFRPGGETSDFIIAKVVKPTIRPELPTIRIEDISGKISWGEIEIPPAEEIVVEDLTLPPVPEEITRTRIEIQLIQEAIRQLENGTHPALQQSREAVAQAKEVLDQAEKNFLEVDAPRKESWEDLPEETQKELLDRLTKDPTIKIAKLKDLCPDDLSFVDFAKMVNEGKRVAPVRAEYLRVKAEYERLVSKAAKSKENALNDLKAQTAAKEKNVEKLIKKFQTTVLLKLMEDCPGYDKFNSELLPYEELIPRIPAMERYEFGWKEKDLFDEAESAWTFTRPCVRSSAGKRKILTVDGIEYAFHWCPPGEFMMGGPYRERKGTFDWIEKNDQHRVKITHGFWLLETEVTQEMWQRVMGNNPSEFKGVKNPVEQVSWDDCQEFCQKLSQKLGQQVKLPTEAQWVYACRAGTTGDYAGDLDSMAWCGEDISSGSTHPVAQKKPNAWGFYDMNGNVEEWCSDYYDMEFYARSPTNDPENTKQSSSRVCCGSCWFSDTEDWLSVRGYGCDPRYTGSLLGLRLLLIPRKGE